MKKIILLLIVIGSAYADSESDLYQLKFMPSSQVSKNSDNTSISSSIESYDLDASARFQKNLKQQLEQMIQHYNQD